MMECWQVETSLFLHGASFSAQTWQELGTLNLLAKKGYRAVGIKLLTLAIWGSNDGIVPVEQADELPKRMPNAQRIIFANAGHACYMKATEKFHEHLIKFIDHCLA